MPPADDASNPSSRSSNPRDRVPVDDATVISRGEPPAASWSGSDTGPRAPGPVTTAEIGRSLEGEMLGPYQLERFVGGGGMGAVFRALDTTLDRIVAVKVLAGRQADDEEMLKRFRNEAQSAARLDHENIGRVHAVGSERGWHYIVFEYIEGTNLRDLVHEQGAFDLARTVDIAIQVADALEHAAERDVVHRDIKPSNIVITPAGRARIVDMGLARLHHVADDRDLTASGMTLGTFDYISPEQARDPRAADVRSDLYSLGCTIFFMLAGRPPFAEGTMVQKLLQHQQAEPPELDQIRPDVPRRFAEIVERLMEKNPLDRYQRPAVLMADLVAFAEDQGLTLQSPRPTSSIVVAAPRPVPTRLPWLVPLVGLLALVGGLWMRSTADRRRAGVAPADVRQPEANPAAAPVLRMGDAGVDGAAGVTTLAETVRRAADGATIELDFDGDRREPPLALGGKRLTIRAAAGRRPVLEFTGLRATVAEGYSAACDVGDGRLELRGVAVRLTAEPSARERTALFAVRSGGLVCDDVTLRMPGGATTTSRPVATAAIVAVTGSSGCEIVCTRTRAAGGADFLDATGARGGTIAVRWSEGAFVSPWRLVAAAGATAGGGVAIDLDLDDVVIACGAGVAVLTDTVAAPVAPRLDVRATECRFVIGDAAVVSQAGGGDAETYRRACTWTDVRSRYEGGSGFRRIDAPSGSVEEGFDDVVPPLVHDPRAGDWPDPAAWSGWGT
jgi:serine/threonine protein kinase